MERKQEKIRCVTALDAEYPEKLKSYGDMPGCLYVRGNLPAPDLPSVAVVGARMCKPLRPDPGFPLCKGFKRGGRADHQRTCLGG